MKLQNFLCKWQGLLLTTLCSVALLELRLFKTKLTELFLLAVEPVFGLRSINYLRTVAPAKVSDELEVGYWVFGLATLFPKLALHYYGSYAP